jgi:hypothetical protein
VVAAPGDSIYNIGKDGGYGWGDGTSDATAVVSGLAALIRAKYPELDAPNVISRIIKTADDAGPPGRDPQYGFGRINPLRALTAGVPLVSANPLLAGASPSPTGPDPAVDPDFDVTKYGDRGGPTDQQVMIIGIGIAVLLVLLLVVAVSLLVYWRRRRRAARAAPAYPRPPGLPPGHPGAPGFPAGHHPPAPAVPAGYGPPQQRDASGEYAPPPGGGAPAWYAPPPGGYAPPPGGAPGGYAPPPAGPSTAGGQPTR